MRQKINASHLERGAYVYVRQSSPRQVVEHGESTARQYALAERAEALGWPSEAVKVIDEDLGRSGASAEGRSGFGRLAHAVAHGLAGAVLALEVSRLARSSEDWQRLLSLCAVAQVAVIDEQTVYDASDKDDRLLLDLKGTMSEAELHWLRLRLTGARQNKARRGELRLNPPTGYVWGAEGFALDPDEAVQRAVRVVFARFAIEPTAWAVVRWARATGFAVPTRRSWADGTSEVVWKPLGISRLSSMLHNPVYAGVYAYGRCPTKTVLVDGEIRRVRDSGHDPDSWLVRIEDAHPGYISWEEYLKNREKLDQNNPRNRSARTGAPREGKALLAGILICGRCGRRMRPSYWGEHNGLRYLCVGERDRGQKSCWSLSGAPIDAAVEELLLEAVAPQELELCLAVEREVSEQSDSLAKQWRTRIERAEYEARLAERRYKAVDPDNRVVARTLERQWEESLRELEDVKGRYEQARRERRVELTDQDRERIRALSRDLEAVWRAPTTSLADRKAMLRLVIEAVTLHPIDVPERETLIRVQWQSGAVTELRVPRPDRRQQGRTPERAAARIRELAAEGLHDEAIAEQLNREKILTGADKTWHCWSVRWARRRGAIERTAPDRPRREPLPDRRADGRFSLPGMVRRFGVSETVVRGWIKRGLISGAREDYKQYRKVWWFDIDEATAARLESLSARSRSRRRAATTQ